MKNFFVVLFSICGILIFAQMKITLITLPENTPKDAQLYLASSLNKWNPKDNAFQFKINNAGLYEIEINTNTSFEYKITQGSWEISEADPAGNSAENHKAIANQSQNVNIVNWTSPKEKQHTTTSNVKILSENFKIPQLKTTRKIWIYLPENYNNSTKKYPVIYMHDGQNLFDNATSFSGEWGVDETMNDLAKNQNTEAIIIGIDNGGDARLDEYSPWQNNKYKKGGKGDLYLDFIVKTLKPYIDKNYRTLSQSQNTAVIGSSMGGLISFYAGIKYPKTFGKVGIFSPAFWFASKDLNFYLNQNKNHLQNSKFYFVAGQHEDETLPQEIEKIHQNLLRKNVKDNNIKIKIDEDGKHTESYWQREFPLAIEWLFSNH